VYNAVLEDGSAKRALRDTLTLTSMLTGIPVSALSRPLGYAAEVAEGKLDPAGPMDAVRGAVTGVASPESR
ncbi:hypothetical protein, partial [uncultured Aquabacterium sp.]|uniref:hypothetical protein n=1 Tax=uncultured Aquabacterium sp. TaxID=158753 RepID=UPI00261A8CF5